MYGGCVLLPHGLSHGLLILLLLTKHVHIHASRDIFLSYEKDEGNDFEIVAYFIL